MIKKSVLIFTLACALCSVRAQYVQLGVPQGVSQYVQLGVFVNPVIS